MENVRNGKRRGFKTNNHNIVSGVSYSVNKVLIRQKLFEHENKFKITLKKKAYGSSRNYQLVTM